MKHMLITVLGVLIICVMFAGFAMNTIVKKQKHVTFEADYDVYGRMSCPYTVKMVDELQRMEKSFRFIDTSTKTGELEFKRIIHSHKLKGLSVPYTINNSTHESFLGFRKLS